MLAPRRFLPSVSSLLALEAVDRLGSVTAAAGDLALTHSAVSRQLKTLEDQLGVDLIGRDGRGVVLTRSGRDYARAARDYLQNLAHASLKVRAAGDRVSLNLAIPPAFGMHWLGPRLRLYAQHHPDVSINLSTRLAPFDFTQTSFDAAIHFGLRDWTGVHWRDLSGEQVIPCCHPDAAPADPADAARLLTMPLLHLESRPGAWEDWFRGRGIDAVRLRGMLFDQYYTLTEAAALGFGVALLPDYLAEVEFDRGRLVPAATGYAEVEGRYALVWPETVEPTRALRDLMAMLDG